MTRVRALYARFRSLIHEGARFGVVGLIGLVVTDGVANLLRYQAGLDRLGSFAIASVIATGVTFVGSRYWTTGTVNAPAWGGKPPCSSG